jgi:hypothetical protein
VEPGHHRVVVAGHRHWGPANAPGADELVRRSVEVAAVLGLAFCSVTWIRVAGSPGPRLAKVTGHPSARSLGELVEPVARALLDVLLQ